VSPNFRKVTKYSKDNLILTFVFDLKLMKELNPISISSKNKWNTMQPFPHLHNQNIDRILQFVRHLNPFQQAGLILWDNNNQKLKVMSKNFVAVNVSIGFLNRGFGAFNLLGRNFDFECLIELVRFNRHHHFLRYFPKWLNYVNEAEKIYFELCDDFEKEFDKVKKFKSWKRIYWRSEKM